MLDAAKTKVRTLIENAGFFAVDLGSLAVGGLALWRSFGD